MDLLENAIQSIRAGVEDYGIGIETTCFRRGNDIPRKNLKSLQCADRAHICRQRMSNRA